MEDGEGIIEENGLLAVLLELFGDLSVTQCHLLHHLGDLVVDHRVSLAVIVHEFLLQAGAVCLQVHLLDDL